MVYISIDGGHISLEPLIIGLSVKVFTHVTHFFMQRCTPLLLVWNSVAALFLARASDIERLKRERVLYCSPNDTARGQYLNKNRMNDQLKSQSLIGRLKTIKAAFPEYRQTALSSHKKALSSDKKALSSDKKAFSPDKTAFSQDKSASAKKSESINNRDSIDNRNSIDNRDSMDKAASINQIAAGVAHEVNNPLAFISSNLNTLQEYTESLKAKLIQQQQLIERFSSQRTLSTIELMALHTDTEINYILADVDGLISDSIEGVVRVKRIVENLSEVPDIGVLNVCDENINKLLDLTVSRVDLSSDKSVRFIKEYDSLRVIKVSVNHLKRALFALVDNAVQAIDVNGEVILRTTQLKHHIRIDVIDNGCGIAEEDLSAIFNPFYSNKQVGDGAGLGLYMAKNIAESHSGALSVASKAGQGTMLTMILPVSHCDTDTSHRPIDSPWSLKLTEG